MAAKLEMGLQKKEEAIGVQGVNPVRGRRGAPFFLAFFAFFVFFCWDLAPAALADESGLGEASPTVPQRPEEIFLYDQAELLNEETKTALREKNADLTEKYGVQKLVLFGSRARGTNAPRSDIDLAVYGCSRFDAFCDCLSEELWSLLKLDLIDMDQQVSETLAQEIRRDGVVLYEKI